MKKQTSIGGQALIEGIMMKGSEKTAIAVRTPEKNIDIEFIKETHIKDKVPFLGLPVIRGVVNFIESMLYGYKALMISADKSGMTDLDEPETKLEKEEKGFTRDDDKKAKASGVLINSVMIIGVVLGVVLAMFLFTYLPALLFDLLSSVLGKALPNGIRPLFEGVLKIAIFIGYIAAVGCTKDIKRVFMYHGAEHKTIFCYENGEELTVENVKKYGRFHPRCGTSFMILMLIVGILISFLVITIFPSITKYRVIWVLIKLLTIPLVCGIGYELIKLCGRYNNKLTRAIAVPGLWVQRLTTKEPEDDMIEVAIVALNQVIPEKDRC